jgi:hypothetical protein
MKWLYTPTLPDYNPKDWQKLPFPERVRQICLSWAEQGYGSPPSVYLIYILKIAAYIAVGYFWIGFSIEGRTLENWQNWWLEPVVFQKAILWTMLFEVLGFGCGSGPLTARYWPPVGGFLHFARPGTIRLPPFAKIRKLNAKTTNRTALDAMLYLLWVSVAFFMLLQPTIAVEYWAGLAFGMLLLGWRDKTIFLAARSEHYVPLLFIFAYSPNWIAATMWIQAGLWFWAGVSKLNHHFPTVVGVMISNSPYMRIKAFKRLMYKDYPNDLRASKLAFFLAHCGTFLEFSIPILLLGQWGPQATIVGLVLMVMLHSFITSSIPMGVPLEWNVIVVFSGFWLFAGHADVSALSTQPFPIALLIAFSVGLIPLLGNFFPRIISFLPSMRYYAGNWAYSIWLVKEGSYTKFENLKKSSPWVYEQLEHFYDEDTGIVLASKVLAFRLMHLLGRVSHDALPQAVDNIDDYEWVDGEIIAGLALGWNFGDGHLHNEQLLSAIQERCSFNEGELRCIFVESQPLFGDAVQYRVVDPVSGEIARGESSIKAVMTRQPWPVA